MTLPRRLLIVDDDTRSLEALAELLRDEGFEVETAASGARALAIAPAFRPQLVLIDVQMPKMDGIELLRQLQSAQPAALAMMMTANGSEAVRRRARQLGAVDFLYKPLDISDVVARIHKALAARGLTGAD